MNIKKIIAWAPCWICFWLGHLFSKGLNFEFLNDYYEEGTWSGTWRDWMVGFFYRPYQVLMNWSVILSDWGSIGLWKEAEDDEDAALHDD